MQNEQKRPNNWWLQEPSYIGFFIREISGLFVALFALNYSAYLFFQVQDLTVPGVITFLHIPLAILGLIGAFIHTFTWLPVLPKTLPFELEKKSLIAFLMGLLIIWLVISYALLQIL